MSDIMTLYFLGSIHNHYYILIIYDKIATLPVA